MQCYHYHCTSHAGSCFTPAAGISEKGRGLFHQQPDVNVAEKESQHENNVKTVTSQSSTAPMTSGGESARYIYLGVYMMPMLLINDTVRITDRDLKGLRTVSSFPLLTTAFATALTRSSAHIASSHHSALALAKNLITDTV